jgi:hypothetical protein
MTNKPTAKTDKKPATPDDILDETIKNTERQKQDTTFETQDRHLNAQFGVAKTLGQSSLTVMKLGSSIAGQRRQKTLDRVLTGLGTTFSTATALAQALYNFHLTSAQTNKLNKKEEDGGPNSESDNSTHGSRNSGMHVDTSGGPGMLQRMWRNAHDRSTERTTTRIAKVGLLAGGPSGGAASGPL